jgi:hypothetical protein
MIALQAHQAPQMPSPDLDSDPSSQEHNGAGLQDSFDTMAGADNSFMHSSFDALPEMGQMEGYDAFNPIQNALNDAHGHGHGRGYFEETDNPTPSKALASGLEGFRI